MRALQESDFISRFHLRIARRSPECFFILGDRLAAGLGDRTNDKHANSSILQKTMATNKKTTEIGSVLINDNGEIGIVFEEKFNSNPLDRRTGDICWTIRTVKNSQVLVIQDILVQIGESCTKWKDTGIVVNPKCYGIEAFTLQEIEMLAAGEKLPHPMSKEDFLAWTETMFALAKDQYKFGQYDVGLSTARCLRGTAQNAFFTSTSQKKIAIGSTVSYPHCTD